MPGLSEAQKKIVSARIKIGACPSCTGTNRHFRDGVYAMPEVTGGMLNPNGGQAFIAVVCQDCGFSAFFSAAVLGVQ